MLPQQKVRFGWPIILPIMLFFIACGGESVEEKMNRTIQEAVNSAAEGVAGQNVEELDKKLREAVASLDSAKLSNVEAVNFRELKKLFPAQIAGLPKGEESGETSQMMGLGISTTQATYGSGSPKVLLKITDTGGAGVLLLSLASFANLNIDREGPEGSERTLDIDGHKAIEKVVRKNGKISSSLTVMVRERFIFGLEAEGLEADALQSAFRSIDLRALPQPESTQ